MVFNSSFGTAIHTLLIISDYSKTQKVTSDVIAEFLGTGPVVVRRLIKTLKEAGFITVAPRKDKAGTTMAMPLDKITLFSVFEAVEPDFKSIVLEPTTRLGRQCPTGIYTNGIISNYVEQMLSAVKEVMKNITLADALASLLAKETEHRLDNPRALFPLKEK